MRKKKGEKTVTFQVLKPNKTYEVVSRKVGKPATQSDPVKVTTDPSGQYKATVQKAKNVPVTKVKGVNKGLAKLLCTKKEKAQVYDGQDAKLFLKMKNIDKTVSSQDKKLCKQKVKSVAPNGKVFTYLDLTLFLQVGDLKARVIHSTKGREVGFRIGIKKSLQNHDKNVIRTFYLLRLHNGKAVVIGKTTGSEISGKTKVFSTYALAYKDEKINREKMTLAINKGFKVKQKGKKVTVKWGTVPGANLYEVYATYCGTYNYELQKPVKGNKVHNITFKKLHGKKLKLKKNFKLYVVAYKVVDGKKIKLSRTMNGHIVGVKNHMYTNPKGILLKTKKITLKVGQSKKVKAKIIKVRKSKKLLSDAHAPKYRYATSDKAIATVDAKGNVKAVGKGTCQVYVFAKNGYAKPVKVIVR